MYSNSAKNEHGEFSMSIHELGIPEFLNLQQQQQQQHSSLQSYSFGGIGRSRSSSLTSDTGSFTSSFMDEDVSTVDGDSAEEDEVYDGDDGGGEFTLLDESSRGSAGSWSPRVRNRSGSTFSAFGSRLHGSSSVRGRVRSGSVPSLIGSSSSSGVSRDDESSGGVTKSKKTTAGQQQQQQQRKRSGSGGRIRTKVGAWTPEEDAKLRELVAKHGPRRWSMIAKSLPGRIGKQARERWFNHLCPDINKSWWTEDEERFIIEFHDLYGNLWSQMSRMLNTGRPANMIKNHWNSTLKRAVERGKKSAKEGDTHYYVELPACPTKRETGRGSTKAVGTGKFIKIKFRVPGDPIEDHLKIPGDDDTAGRALSPRSSMSISPHTSPRKQSPRIAARRPSRGSVVKMEDETMSNSSDSSSSSSGDSEFDKDDTMADRDMTEGEEQQQGREPGTPRSQLSQQQQQRLVPSLNLKVQCNTAKQQPQAAFTIQQSPVHIEPSIQQQQLFMQHQQLPLPPPQQQQQQRQVQQQQPRPSESQIQQFLNMHMQRKRQEALELMARSNNETMQHWNLIARMQDLSSHSGWQAQVYAEQVRLQQQQQQQQQQQSFEQQHLAQPMTDTLGDSFMDDILMSTSDWDPLFDLDPSASPSSGSSLFSML